MRRKREYLACAPDSPHDPPTVPPSFVPPTHNATEFGDKMNERRSEGRSAHPQAKHVFGNNDQYKSLQLWLTFASSLSGTKDFKHMEIFCFLHVIFP